MRKIIQVFPAKEGVLVGWVVLCDDGAMFIMTDKLEWKRIPNIPQEKVEWLEGNGPLNLKEMRQEISKLRSLPAGERKAEVMMWDFINRLDQALKMSGV